MVLAHDVAERDGDPPGHVIRRNIEQDGLAREGVDLRCLDLRRAGRAAAMATRPEPEAKSRTRRPATLSG